MVVFEVMLQLFIVLVIGYLLTKKDVLNADTGRRISALVVNVTMPLLIISAVAENLENGSLKEVLGVFFLGIASYIIFPLVAWCLAKAMKAPIGEQGTYQFMLIFSNCTFMGYPVLNAIFGSEAIFLSSIYNMPFNLVAFSYGIYLLSKDGGAKASFDWKKCLNPGVISAIIGFIIYALQIELPRFVLDTCSMVGDMTTPLSMIVLGVSLAQIPLKEVFTDVRIYVMTAFRLLGIPVLTYLLLKGFIHDEMILGVAVMTQAMPVASMSVMLSNQYGGNVKLASVGVFVSTLLSVVTIPVLSLWLFP